MPCAQSLLGKTKGPAHWALGEAILSVGLAERLCALSLLFTADVYALHRRSGVPSEFSEVINYVKGDSMCDSISVVIYDFFSDVMRDVKKKQAFAMQ